MDKSQLDSIKDAVLRSYRDTIKVDSTEIADNGDTVSVKFRHYCSYDNKISVPQEYLDVYGISEFQTHNFISEVEFKINSRIIYKGAISKNDFSKSISMRLKKHGVLYYSPDLSISGKRLSIDYNINIPLSGEGWGYTISIDSTGKKITGSLD
ncbi:hypothetical protein ACFFGT_15725 [Mucilaginibacter angelicae]|uniref:Uncharacterized protein n=1 Tax=Mucilaginibacter angelicae TaxID=869718 RepID=A0ABV6L866_9SPHI